MIIYKRVNPINGYLKKKVIVQSYFYVHESKGIKIQLFPELSSHFPSFSWYYLGQHRDAMLRFVRAVEERTGRSPLLVFAGGQHSTHCLLQEQLLKLLATCQKAADYKNKPYPSTIHKRKEMKALCFSYKPELGNARRVEQAVLEIRCLWFYACLLKTAPWHTLLPLPRDSLEKSGCCRCCQSRLQQNIT